MSMTIHKLSQSVSQIHLHKLNKRIEWKTHNNSINESEAMASDLNGKIIVVTGAGQGQLIVIRFLID